MPAYTKLNFKRDVEDMAPKFDLSPGAESRFARVPLALEQSGLSYFKLAPGFRFPFGHRHTEQEEVYVVISGNAVLRLDDDELTLERLDAVRIPVGTKRAVQGGPDGCELLAFGAPNTQNKDAEMLPGWWGD
jgi:mannose-6-phosphate isomerase-like protein (cupin superfamily)